MVSCVLLTTGIIFLSLLIFKLIKGLENIVSKLSALIYTLAGSTYILMGYLNYIGDDTPIRVLRYMDWFITVPLLVIQMGYFFSGRYNMKRAIPPIILSTVMLIFGLLGELNFNQDWSMVTNGQFMNMTHREFKIVMGMISVGFMSNLFISIARCLTNNHLKLFVKVLLLWCFYPIVYFIPESVTTILLFSLVDLTAKAGMGIMFDREYKNKRTS
jgi:bacteriorhodopsin